MMAAQKEVWCWLRFQTPGAKRINTVIKIMVKIVSIQITET